MEFTLETMYKDLIKFSYCSFDRIVIRGHVPILQGTDGGGVVTWARSLDPNIILTNSWFESLAAKFHINVKKFAKEHNIPIISVSLKQEKNEIAKEHLPKDQKFVGVYLILKAREMTYSFTSQTSKHNKNPYHRNIDRQERCVDHFYFYILDQHWGPICIRFSSHLPFNVKVYLNGNRWLLREALQKSLDVKADDNAIIDCNNPQQLQNISNSLNEGRIRSVCDHWVYRLFPILTYEERHKTEFQYHWFMHQVEYAHNMVFKSPWSLTKLFHRHIVLNYEHFHPHQIETFFGHYSKKKYIKDCNLRMYHRSESVSVMKLHSRACSIKQYNKKQRIFRSEITVDNVKDLNIRKSITNLDILKNRIINILCSFQQVQSSAHQATCTSGELTALAEPGNVGCSHVPGIRLDNERIMTIIALLPRLVRYPEGFRISDLQELICNVTQKVYSMSQVCYDLRKLRAKGLIRRLPGQKRYMLSEKGASLSMILPSLANRLCNPLINIAINPTNCPMPERLKERIDQSYYKIEREIFSITEMCGLIFA